MAAIVFDTIASTELTQVRGQGHNPLSPIDDGARVRIKRFNYLATAAEAVDTRIELVELPAGAVVIETALSAMALSNSAELSVGYTLKTTPVDTYEASLLAATAVAASSGVALRGNAVGTDGIQSVYATTSVGALAADDTFAGFILYVVNT